MTCMTCVKRLIVPLATCLLLSGCMTSSQIKYRTSGSLQQLLTDRETCYADVAAGGSGAAEAGGGSMRPGAAPSCNAFNECLRRMGHVRDDAHGNVVLPPQYVKPCSNP